jgi:hypothetical protein
LREGFQCDLSRDDVRRNVQATLDFYGGWHLNAMRILSVNGDVDPWSVLALTEDLSKQLPAHWVKGGEPSLLDSQSEEKRQPRDCLCASSNLFASLGVVGNTRWHSIGNARRRVAFSHLVLGDDLENSIDVINARRPLQ